MAELGVTTIITEISAARKERARTIADHVLDPADEDVHARVLDLTGGVGADVGFECAGVNAVMDQVLDAVRPTGVVVNVAIWGKPAAIDMQRLVIKEIDLRGSFAYVRDHPETIALVQRGGVDLSPFITSRIGLEQLVTHGLTALLDDAGTAVKILVHP
jgi:(R,R)-butanediol dehydrogenase/meso-butanediol dehydrogenase/diacetyl reductase